MDVVPSKNVCGCVLFLLLALLVADCWSKVMFLEEFNDKRYKLRWSKSIDNLDKQGKFELASGPLSVSGDEAQGLKTDEDYRYYLLSCKMRRQYTNRNKTLVVQFQAIFPSMMECGGAYIKVLGYELEPTTFASRTPYKIMFGPDVCGFAMEDREVKVILNHRGKYYRLHQLIRFHISHVPQLFTLVLRPDNTYEVHVNMSVTARGHIGRDFRMIRPRLVRDKNARPGPDWVSQQFVMDRTIPRPARHVHQPATIVDPLYFRNSSLFPDLSHGLPVVPNPDYMLPWHPPFMRNPRYRGPFVAPLVPNSLYNPNEDFYFQPDLGGVGIDVWQMSSGVIYDNILITDNEKFARKFAKEHWLDVVEASLQAERNAQPYNHSMEQDSGSGNQEDNEAHTVHTDRTGQQSCYNNMEATKNTIFGPSKEQIQLMQEERNKRMIKMKAVMDTQLGPVSQYRFYDPRFFEPASPSSDQNQDFDPLATRIELLESRKVTPTARFLAESGLLPP